MRLLHGTVFAALAVGTAFAGEAPSDACVSPPLAAAERVVLRQPLTEPDRGALSAAVYLTLRPFAAPDAPASAPQASATPCSVATFAADGATWRIAATTGDLATHRITAEGRGDSFLVTPGPNIDDARGWSTLRRLPPATNATGYYLVGQAGGGDRFVFRIYRSAPGTKQIADDVTEVVARGLAPVAAYDAEGEAVSLFLDTASGRRAELFRPEILTGDRSAYLYGPDGDFFAPTIGGGVTLRGSGEVCPLAFGRLDRTGMGVVDSRKETLDLACRYELEDSRVSLFFTRRPDKTQDRVTFAEALRAAQEDTGVRRSTEGFAPEPGRTIRAGQAWIDSDGLGEGLWFLRRGDYIIEVRATFDPQLGDDVFDLLATVLIGVQPEDLDNPA